MAAAQAYDELCAAGAIVVFEAKGNSEEARRKKMIKDTGRTIKRFLYNKGRVDVGTSTRYIGGENKEFVKGKGNTMLVSITAYEDGSDKKGKAAEVINSNKKELASEIEEDIGCKVSRIRMQPGRLDVTNVAVTLDFSE